MVTDGGPRVLHPLSQPDSGSQAHLPLMKMLFPHSFQRGTDQVAIGLEESRWNPGELGFDSLCPILEHSRIFYRVLLRDDV